MMSILAAWRVPGSPQEIRELYRKRFATESNDRQLGQARIHTSTRSPVERLLLALIVIALVLRILWAWMHWKYFADGTPDDPVLDVDRLRYRRMLDWIAHVVAQSPHDGTEYVT